MVTPLVAQPPHQRPHVAPQLDVDAGGRLVEEQDLRLVRQRLGDHHPPLHPARQRHDPALALVPQRQLAQHLLDVAPGWRGAPEQPAAEADRRPHRLERVGGQLLRHQADLEARRAVVAHDVVPVGHHRPARRRHDAADDVDERRLAGAVRPEQREDLAAPDLEIDPLERDEPRGVGLLEAPNADDGSETIGSMGARPRDSAPTRPASRRTARATAAPPPRRRRGPAG